jgi:hypothetical protein
MFVLSGPDAVLVLSDAGDLFRLDTPVATAAGAPAWPVVFADWRGLAVPGDFQSEAHHHTPRRIRRISHVSLGVGKIPLLVADWACLYPIPLVRINEEFSSAVHARTGTNVIPVFQDRHSLRHQCVANILGICKFSAMP